jgi:hypothetical protein
MTGQNPKDGRMIEKDGFDKNFRIIGLQKKID